MAEEPQDVGIEPKTLTTSVSLAEGQKRLRALILYIADECREAPRFGLVKLNKILWLADYSAYAARGVPITGRAYRRLKWGPAPVEMPQVLNDMFQADEISYWDKELGDGIVEQRVVPDAKVDVRVFAAEDLRFVDRAIAYYWDMTGTETSNDSHGVAWKTRHDGDPMPYELAYLSDRQVAGRQRARLLDMATTQGWKSY